jgi:hypothetical protein
MVELIQRAVDTLAAVLCCMAIAAGAIWSWKTSPSYTPEDEYFVTARVEDTYLQREGQPFDITSEYHRSLLVSGPYPKPFVAIHDANAPLVERGTLVSRPDIGWLHIQNCGFFDQVSQRSIWRGVTLCNGADLTGKSLKAAVAVFRDKVDDEVWSYRISLVRNAADKICIAFLIAVGFNAVAVAGVAMIPRRMA